MKVAKYFLKNPQEKPFFDYLEAAAHIVDEHGSLDETEDPHSHYTHLSNFVFVKVGQHFEQAGHHYDALEGTNFGVALSYLFEKSMKTREGTQLERFLGNFIESESIQNDKP